MMIGKIKIYTWLVLLWCACNSRGAQEYDVKNHPLMKQENIVLLHTLAGQVSAIIDANFPAKKQVLMGLGQSPAYVLEMIKLIDGAEARKNRTYIHVAFSGNYYGLYGNICPQLYEKCVQGRSYYKKYLAAIGLSKNDLDTHTDDTQYIIVDVCYTGEGLKSFLSFFDDYIEKPGVVYMQIECYELWGFSLDLAVKNKRLKMYKNREQRLMRNLSEADNFKDRLVPYFSYKQWKTVDPLEFQPGPNAQVILDQLKKYMENNSKINVLKKGDVFNTD